MKGLLLVGDAYEHGQWMTKSFGLRGPVELAGVSVGYHLARLGGVGE